MALRPPVPVGSVLNETYRLERLIARGGMGAVYEAAHLRMTRRFAVKVLAGPVTRHPELMERFRREAAIIGAIGHPHIVEAVDFNKMGDGSPYIVMELLEGETLGARLQRDGALQLTAAAHIFMQAASALDAAHSKGIVHRDLKPQNIFLCKRGRQDDFVKIFDFGISKVEDAMTELTKANTVMGTVLYMSPEQIRGERDLDRRSDVYAMGSILHEMLSGSTPFNAEVTLEIFRKVIHTPPPRLSKLRPGVPPGIEAVVLRSLAKAREERFATMLDFWVALAAAMRAAGLVVPESIEERRSLWPSRDDATHVEREESKPVQAPPAPEVARVDTGPLEAATTEVTQLDRPAPPRDAMDVIESLANEGQPSGSVPLDTGDLLHMSPEDLASRPTVALATGDLLEYRPTTHTHQVRRRRGALYGLAAVAVLGAIGGLIAGLTLWNDEPVSATGPDHGLPRADVARPDTPPTKVAAAAPDTAAPRPDLRAADVRPQQRDAPVKQNRVKLRVAPRPASGPGKLAIQASAGGRPALPQILVDGQPRGQPPLLLTLPAGLHTVEARLAGHRPVTRQVRVVPRSERSVVLELKPR